MAGSANGDVKRKPMIRESVEGVTAIPQKVIVASESDIQRVSKENRITTEVVDLKNETEEIAIEQQAVA